jgi:transposase-like protein
MKSRKYCPKCKSFNIKRNHRSVFQKYALLVSGLYLCEECDFKFTDKQINKNTLEEWKKFDMPAEDKKIDTQEAVAHTSH